LSPLQFFLFRAAEPYAADTADGVYYYVPDAMPLYARLHIMMPCHYFDQSRRRRMVIYHSYADYFVAATICATIAMPAAAGRLFAASLPLDGCQDEFDGYSAILRAYHVIATRAYDAALSATFRYAALRAARVLKKPLRARIRANMPRAAHTRLIRHTTSALLSRVVAFIDAMPRYGARERADAMHASAPSLLCASATC